MKIEECLNRVIQGDCIEFLKTLPSDSVDLCVTSPPYNLRIEYDCYNDNLLKNDYYNWCEKWMREIFRVLKNDGRFCLNHYLHAGDKNSRQSPISELLLISQKISFKYHGIAVWTEDTLSKKTAWGSWLSASAPYINCPLEAILILYKNNWKKEKKGESTIGKDKFIKLSMGIWDMRPQREITKCNFPIELPLNCIEMFSYKGDLILDPFMGGWTTALAAKKSARNFIGCELSEAYCEIGRKRLEEI
jgi:site-specific DNA-methyltransferase (adenine-specific)